MIPTIEEIKNFIIFQHPSEYRISQYFGQNFKQDGKWFYGEIVKGINKHNGIDYACPIGSPVYAPCDMQIARFYYENKGKGYGTTIWGWSKQFKIGGVTYVLEIPFAHLSKIGNIKIGEWFLRGRQIALSGNTGPYTTGPHLHAGMARLLRKRWYGGWEIVNVNNGVRGYFDVFDLINLKLNFAKYEDKLVYSGKTQQGKRHYKVVKGQLYWIQNEVEFFLSGFEFKDAVSINPNLINVADPIDYKIDWSDPRVKQAKKLLGFAVDNPDLAEKYYNKLFK